MIEECWCKSVNESVQMDSREFLGSLRGGSKVRFIGREWWEEGVWIFEMVSGKFSWTEPVFILGSRSAHCAVRYSYPLCPFRLFEPLSQGRTIFPRCDDALRLVSLSSSKPNLRDVIQHTLQNVMPAWCVMNKVRIVFWLYIRRLQIDAVKSPYDHVMRKSHETGGLNKLVSRFLRMMKPRQLSKEA
jgi:hypothetical protein